MNRDTLHPFRTLKASVKEFVKKWGFYPIAGAEGEESWRDTLPDDIKGNPVLEKYASSNDAVKALVEAQKLIGRDKIPVPPAEGATESDWNAVYDGLGRPKTAADYILAMEEGTNLPEGMPLDDGMVKEFTELAHKNGFLPKQVEAMYRWYMNNAAKQFTDLGTANKEQQIAASKKLTFEYGAAYKEKVALAERVFKTVADKDAIALFEEGLGNNPAMIRMFAKIGGMISEDQLGGIPKGLTMTPEEAQGEIDTIRNNMDHPFWHGDKPGHKEAVDKIETLTKLTLVGQKAD